MSNQKLIKVTKEFGVGLQTIVETLHGKGFQIYKFRTMSVDAPNISSENMQNSSKSYITKTGRIMRKTSLDELPQLFNVLRGEMSYGFI